MMKEIQRKKKVLIDLTNYGSLTAGFGQIAANYATAFSSMLVDDLHFVYLLRQKYMQEFGPNVTSVPVRRINKFFPFTLPKVDVWHAVINSASCCVLPVVQSLSLLYTTLIS